MNADVALRLIASIVNMCLGLFILYKNPRKNLNVVGSVALFLIGIWMLGYFLEGSATNINEVLIWIRICDAGVIFIVGATLHLALIYSKKEKFIRGWLRQFLLYLPFVVFYILFLTNDQYHLFYTIASTNGELHWIYGPACQLFIIVNVLFIFAAVFLLLKISVRSKNINEKKGGLLILVGVLFPFISNIVTSILLIFGGEIPTFVIGVHITTSTYNLPTDPSPLIVMAICTSIGIMRYRLFTVELTVEECIKTPPEYSLKKGLSYMIKEEKLDKSYEIFHDQTTHGNAGLVLTKLPPEKVRERYHIIKSPILWLTFKEVENAISPKDMGVLKSTIADFIGKAENPVILLDCFDQIVVVNGFEKSIEILRGIKEICTKNNANILLSINPELFEKEQIVEMEKELIVLKTAGGGRRR
ncbi:MAG: DUF835 domain-containing protein [Thermoplasmata archaeon]